MTRTETNELKTFFSDQLGKQLTETLDDFRKSFRRELSRELQSGLDELRFDIRELRQDMNRRFDEQDDIHNQILQTVGLRFEGNEQRLGQHEVRILKLEKRST